MSTRNIHVNTASYTLLVAGKKKNTGEEWDVLEFSSLTELKKYRKSHPEKMAFSYSYALSRGVDTQFRHCICLMWICPVTVKPWLNRSLCRI